MRGTTMALRLLFGLELTGPPASEWLAADGDRAFHLFDAFALVNVLLCSAVPPGTTTGRSTSEMRTRCLRHFRETLRILEPTVLVLQGKGVAKWIRPSFDSWQAITETQVPAEIEGRPVHIAALSHPSARYPLNWARPSLAYVRDVVVPTRSAVHDDIFGSPLCEPVGFRTERHAVGRRSHPPLRNRPCQPSRLPASDGSRSRQRTRPPPSTELAGPGPGGVAGTRIPPRGGLPRPPGIPRSLRASSSVVTALPATGGGGLGSDGPAVWTFALAAALGVLALASLARFAIGRRREGCRVSAGPKAAPVLTLPAPRVGVRDQLSGGPGSRGARARGVRASPGACRR